jgi:hypothetical protein
VVVPAGTETVRLSLLSLKFTRPVPEIARNRASVELQVGRQFHVCAHVDPASRKASTRPNFHRKESIERNLLSSPPCPKWTGGTEKRSTGIL